MGTKYDIPEAMFAKVRGLDAFRAHQLAVLAVQQARAIAPKGYLAVGESGMASRLQPYSGRGYFGIRWVDQYAWFQEHGAQPFTMSSLQGKTIPMWIKDPTGTERIRNPKAKTRVRPDGVVEVLIFRRAAKKGQRKVVTTKYGNKRIVPASYPGAPGRIALREARHPYTSPGKAAGAISSPNVGVRWRNPGLNGLHFMQHGIQTAAIGAGLIITQIVAKHPSGQEELVA
jgi:hypothetical protein